MSSFEEYFHSIHDNRLNKRANLDIFSDPSIEIIKYDQSVFDCLLNDDDMLEKDINVHIEKKKMIQHKNIFDNTYYHGKEIIVKGEHVTFDRLAVEHINESELNNLLITPFKKSNRIRLTNEILKNEKQTKHIVDSIFKKIKWNRIIPYYFANCCGGQNERAAMMFKWMVELSGKSDVVFDLLFEKIESEQGNIIKLKLSWVWLIMSLNTSDYDSFLKLLRRDKLRSRLTKYLKKSIVQHVASKFSRLEWFGKEVHEIERIVDVVHVLKSLFQHVPSNVFLIVFNIVESKIHPPTPSNNFRTIDGMHLSTRNTTLIEHLVEHSNPREKLDIYISIDYLVKSSREINQAFVQSLLKTRWIKSIHFDMRFIEKETLIKCLETTLSMITQNQFINDVIIYQNTDQCDSFMTKEKNPKKTKNCFNLKDYCFFKNDYRVVRMYDQKESRRLQQLVDQITKQTNFRNYLIQSFKAMVENQMFDACDSFLKKHYKSAPFVFFNSIESIFDKLNDKRWIEILSKYDFDWSIAFTIHDQRYSNVFHALMHKEEFKNNMRSVFQIFDRYNVFENYKKQWIEKNEDGISVDDLFSFHGHYAFPKNSIIRNKITFDENVWHNVFEFSSDQKVQYSLVFSNINKTTFNVVRQHYTNELRRICDRKPYGMHYIFALFCSIYYKIEIVRDILFESFHDEMGMTKEDCDFFKKEILDLDSPLNNDGACIFAVCDLFFENDEMIKRLSNHIVGRKNPVHEMWDFTRHEFFEFFGVKVNQELLYVFFESFVEGVTNFQ